MEPQDNQTGRGEGWEEAAPPDRHPRIHVPASCHGGEGNLPVTDIDCIHPIREAFIDGAVGMRIPRCSDYNSGDRQ